jgi:hypothetical protein
MKKKLLLFKKSKNNRASCKRDGVISIRNCDGMLVMMAYLLANMGAPSRGLTRGLFVNGKASYFHCVETSITPQVF